MVAFHNFTKEDEDDLTFSEGDIIYVTEKSVGGWHKGVCNGEVGLFPENFVEVVEGNSPEGTPKIE